MISHKLIATAALLTVIACSGQKKAPAPPVPVMAAEAAIKDVQITISAIGSVEPVKSVTVKSLVGGELQGIHFSEGQDVAEGALLFTIDPRPYRAALDSAQAALARDLAKAKSAEAEAQRYAGLVEKDYVTRQQYDDSLADAEAMKATVKVDEASVEDARLNLAYCTIRSPLAARAGSLLVHAGNIVKPNDEKGLVVLNQVSPIFVSFALPERRLTEIREASGAGKLAVNATTTAGASAVGELSFINNAVDEKTGTILLKAKFPNSDRALWPGQFVNVSLVLSTRKNAVVLPSTAVQTGQQGEFVFVIRPDSYVDMKPVVTGPRLDGEIVIEKGIGPGERVVTDGHLRIVPFEPDKHAQDRAVKVEIKESLDATAKPGKEKATG